MPLKRKVTLCSVLATGLWVGTVVFLLAGIVVAIALTSNMGFAIGFSLCAMGLACSAAAATATIRAMIDGQTRVIEDAFDLGREVGAGNMRRIR